jgi:hypothetical protein
MCCVISDGILAFLLFAVMLACYASTLAPGILGGDAGELQFVPFILSLAHPTGYPLQTLLNKLWVTIVPWGTIAWRTNLLSALVAALGVGLTFVTVRCATSRRGPGLIAAVMLGLAPIYWGQAVIGDKYALNGLLTAFLVWQAWRFYEQPSTQSWVALGMATGVGLAHHRSFLVFSIPLAFLVATRARHLMQQIPKLLAGGVALLVPLVLYLYIPFASARGLPPYHSQIRNWAQFVAYMRDPSFISRVRLCPQGENMRYYLVILLANFGLPMTVIALSGLLVWVLQNSQQRSWIAFLLSGFVLQAYLAQNYDVPRRFVFFIPSYVCVAALTGIGLAGWLQLVQLLFGRFRWPVPSVVEWLLLCVLFAWPLSRLPDQWRVQWAEQRVAQPMDIWRQDLKTGGQAERLAASLRLVPPRALIVGDWEQATPLWYAQQVERVCPDCLILAGLDNMIDYAARASAEGRPLYVARTLNQAADWSDPTAVGPLVYLAPAPETRLPADLIPVEVSFDGQVQLAGYTWPFGRPSTARGTVLPISLVWQLTNSPTPDYAIALRLIGPAGEVWRTDTPAPVLGMHPFGRLQAGQVIADYYEVPIPHDAPTGQYMLVVILYQVVAANRFVNATVTDPSGRALGESVTVLTLYLPPD